MSIRIPLYGCHWFAGDPGQEEKPNPTAEYIGQEQVEQFCAAYHPQLEWDSLDRVACFHFYRDDVRDWVVGTDKAGFQQRLNRVGDRGLHGFVGWWEPSPGNMAPAGCHKWRQESG